MAISLISIDFTTAPTIAADMMLQYNARGSLVVDDMD